MIHLKTTNTVQEYYLTNLAKENSQVTNIRMFLEMKQQKAQPGPEILAKLREHVRILLCVNERLCITNKGIMQIPFTYTKTEV